MAYQNQSQTQDPYSQEYVQRNVPGEVGEMAHMQLAEAAAALQILRDVIPDKWGAELQEITPVSAPAPETPAPVAEVNVSQTYDDAVAREAARSQSVDAPNANVDVTQAQQGVDDAFTLAA